MSLKDLPTVDLTDTDGDDVFAAPATVAPEPEVLEAEAAAADRLRQIELEKAEADRVRALGPEPHPEITLEMRENNPSDYLPAKQAVVENPSIVPAAVPEKASDADTRQRWICVVQETGIRTGHPPFRSDAHLLMEMVRCPVCNGVSVRKVDASEVLPEDGLTDSSVSA